MVGVRHKRGFDWAGWLAETIITFLEATGLMFLAIMASLGASILVLTVTGTWWVVELIFEALGG